MRTITLAIAGLLLFSGCSSDPKPIEPTATKGTPAYEPPKLPDRATKDTPDGAGEFVRFWVSAFNYGALTGRTNLMIMHAKSCKPCREYASDFAKLPASRRPKGDAWTLKRVSVVLARDPIEVETIVAMEGESRQARLTFVLNDHAPFEIADIYSRS